MFMTHTALNSKNHSTEICCKGQELKRKRTIKEDSRKASEVVFTISGIPIGSEKRFIYLGRLLLVKDDGPTLVGPDLTDVTP
jgi:hypothetical protein